MSDESNGAVATQAPAPVAAPEQGAARGSSKAMLVVGAVAVVVLAVFAYVLFGTGGDSAEDLGTVPKAEAPAKPATDDKAKSTDKAKSNDKSSTKATDVEGRNPFVSLTSPVTTTGTETTTESGTGTTPATPVGETVTVALVSVGNGTVTTTVDSKTYKKVAEGETFGSSFQVYAIFNDECAGFLYGDDSFALCEGKSVQLAKL